MDKERIKELAANQNFISGIYNYCDRWCDRCIFTSKCMNFAISEEQFSEIDSLDITHDAFWKKLEETFKLTLDMLKEFALKNKINLDSIDLKAGINKTKKLYEKSENKITNTANEYIEIVNKWFKSEEDIFRDKENELKKVEKQGGDGIR